MGQRIAELIATVSLEGAAAVDKGLSNINGKLGGLKDGLGGAVKGLTGLDLGSLGAAAAVGALAAGLKYSMAQAAEAEQIMAQTEAVIKSTGGAAGYTAGQIEDMASALSHQSTFADDAIQKGENLLLTFTNIKGNLPAATTAMLDMATAMGTDAEGGALQLGKALNDPIAGISALTRVGVTFTSEQKALIKTMVETGDVAGAQKVILAELNKEFGGSAQAALKTYSGQMAQLKNNTDNVAESIGRRLLPPLTALTKALNDQFTAQDRYDKLLAEGALTERDLQEIRAADLVGNYKYGLSVLELAEARQKATQAVEAHADALNEFSPKVEKASNNLASATYWENELQKAMGNNDVILAAAAALDEEAAKADWAQDRVHEAAAAHDALLKSQLLWKAGVADEVVRLLDAAGVKGERYLAALVGIDTVMGTSLANEDATQKKLEGIVAQFAKSGDVVAFDIAMKGWAQGGASEAAAKAEAAANKIDDIGSALRDLPIDTHINITTDHYDEWHAGGHVNETTGIGPGAASGADFIVPPGYPHDSFPMRVQSGEHVQVTPAGVRPGQPAREVVTHAQMREYIDRLAATMTRAFRDVIQQNQRGRGMSGW